MAAPRRRRVRRPKKSRADPSITNTVLYFQSVQSTIDDVLMHIASSCTAVQLFSDLKELTTLAQQIPNGNKTVNRAYVFMKPIQNLVKYFENTSASLKWDMHSSAVEWIKEFCYLLHLASKQQDSYVPRDVADPSNPEPAIVERGDHDYDPVEQGGMNDLSPAAREQFLSLHLFQFSNLTLQLYFLKRAIQRADVAHVGQRRNKTAVLRSVLNNLETYNSLAQMAMEYFFENKKSVAEKTEEELGHILMGRIFFRIKVPYGSMYALPFPAPVDPFSLWQTTAEELIFQMTNRANEPDSPEKCLVAMTVFKDPISPFHHVNTDEVFYALGMYFERVRKLNMAVWNTYNSLTTPELKTKFKPIFRYVFGLNDAVDNIGNLESLMPLEED